MEQKRSEYFYKKHIFICTNVKENGKCCGSSPIPKETIQELKNMARSLQLNGPGNVRVSSSGCMGRCESGPIAVMYPRGEWFCLENKDQRKRLEKLLNETNNKNSLDI